MEKKNPAGFWDRDAAEDIGPLLRRPLGDLKVLLWLQVD